MASVRALKRLTLVAIIFVMPIRWRPEQAVSSEIGGEGKRQESVKKDE